MSSSDESSALLLTPAGTCDGHTNISLSSSDNTVVMFRARDFIKFYGFL